MCRKFERILAYIGSAWQIGSGLYTMFIYSMNIRGLEGNIVAAYHAEEASAKVMAGNLYMFSVTFGMLFVVIGALNLYLARKLGDKKTETKIPVWFIVCGFLSYLETDFISTLAFIAAGIIALARNKTIREYFNSTKAV